MILICSEIEGGVGNWFLIFWFISIDGTTASVCCWRFKSIGGRLLLGARNDPLVFNVDEIFDEGRGISISGRFDFGAAIVWVLVFIFVDLFPKHEQSGNVDDDFFFISIGCFSVVFIVETIFDGGLGTSSSNDGGGNLISFDNVKTGSGDGTWKGKFEVVCF